MYGADGVSKGGLIVSHPFPLPSLVTHLPINIGLSDSQPPDITVTADDIVVMLPAR